MSARFPVLLILLITLFSLSLSGCELVEGVFRMGMFLTLLGFLLVVTILILIFNFAGRSARKDEMRT